MNIEFNIADALSWNTDKKYDLILCTGGIHHLPYKTDLNRERIVHVLRF